MTVVAEVPAVMNLAWLIPALPLAGAAVLLLTGSRWRGSSAGWLGTATIAGAFGLAVAVFAGLVSMPGADRQVVKSLYDWFQVGALRIPVDLRVDPLSVTMALVVTGVGSLIHLYAIDYMHGDPRFGRFFAYMNLFVGFMLILVLANNFLLLYLGWEGVGLCSYLLIGFWFERKAAADAAKKAFVTTRIGDSAMLIGIIFIWIKFGSLDFGVVFGGAAGLAGGTATIMALLLFAGAVGKSAQLPLHVWLPDAMEGPTPVSALIHAATMVTAGVYLVVRTHAIFEASPVALTVVAVVGIATAVYAGLSAIAQDDIKRMLAYSTISQLGFMFLGAGLRAYAAAIFLLVAHAFFKAALFLDAGSVMHGLHDETDLRKMGGLRRAMPVTAATWVVGWLAMAGIPPLAGFFAKDQIIAAASQEGRYLLWAVALLGSLLTAVYMTRGSALAFFGEPRWEHEPHEATAKMRISVIVLGLGAALGGILGLSAISGILPTFLEGVVGPHAEPVAGPSELVLSEIAVGVALAGTALAWYVYGSGRFDWQAMQVRFASLKLAVQRGFYVDDLYSNWIVNPAKAMCAFLAYVFDRRAVDGLVNGTGRVVTTLSSAGSRLQNGLVRVYAAVFLIGAVAGVLYMVVRL
jgi:NADH-quinone oxidoreductase subunit L